MAVEHRDDEDRAEVVDDGQREQERAEGDRQLRAHHGEDGERERDVGGHRDAPADHGVGVAHRDDRAGVEHRGHDHAADRRDDRDDRLRRLAQRAEDELVLELEARDEEEHREQSVGGPGLQGEVEVQGRRPHDGVGELVVALAPRRVRPDEREDRRREQQRPADGLLPQRSKQPRPLPERQPLEHDVPRRTRPAPRLHHAVKPTEIPLNVPPRAIGAPQEPSVIHRPAVAACPVVDDSGTLRGCHLVHVTPEPSVTPRMLSTGSSPPPSCPSSEPTAPPPHAVPSAGCGRGSSPASISSMVDGRAGTSARWLPCCTPASRRASPG